MIKSHAFFIFLLALVLSCQDSITPRYNVLSSLSNNHFEGMNIGDSLFVISKMLNSPVVIDEEEIQFTETIHDDRLLGYKGYLIFDKSRLYEITIDFQLTADSLVDGYFMECKEALDEVYGKSDMDNGYAHWASGSINEKVIEIELFNEHLDSKMPIVSVQFFEDFDKQFYAE